MFRRPAVKGLFVLLVLACCACSKSPDPSDTAFVQPAEVFPSPTPSLETAASPDALADSAPMTPVKLHEAAQRGDITRVEQLLAEDPALLEQLENIDGVATSPLHAALLSDQVEMATRLIDQGAKLEHYIDGTPLLFRLAYQGHRESILFLQQQGADLNITTAKGARDTVMHHLADAGSPALMPFLHSLGVKVDAQNRLGNTPLHNAVQALQTEAAAQLLKLGADSSLKNREGKSPLELAIAADAAPMVTLLTAPSLPANAP